MAGWSKIVDGSALDFLKTLQKLGTNELWFDLKPDSTGSLEGGEHDTFRCSFNQFLSVFLKQICGSNSFRPLSPMLGNGQSVDLFKLYLVVRGKGGYETVSENGLWNSVATESGLDPGVASAVKLIYVKYLDSLDRWRQRIVREKDSKGGLQDSGTDLGGFSMDLESDLKGVLSEIPDQKKKEVEYPRSGLENLDKNELKFTGVGNLCDADDVKSFLGLDGDNENADEKKIVTDDKDDTILDSSLVREGDSNKKRKREFYLGMLDWISEAAKNPCDPAIGSLPERSKWKSYGSEQLWKQVLLAREALFSKHNVDSSAEQSIWQKQKMHPTMYDDHTGSERLRCSQRLLSAKVSRSLSLKMSQARACSESSSSATQSDSEEYFDRQSDPLTADSVIGWCSNFSRKRIPVGPYFQANVPEWTGEAYQSDSKWLGTRVWPLEKGEHSKYLIKRERIGKGRDDSCGCKFSGSITCVKFHIAEKRMRVKLELGMAFYNWKFNNMGEDAALSWTKEEEQNFQDIVRSNPISHDKCFWDEIFKFFPSKRRGDLVSYYFNVFLLQRRGYQNRSTPINIDSDDDDESDFGTITKGVGYEAVKSTSFFLCSLKKVHLNFR